MSLRGSRQAFYRREYMKDVETPDDMYKFIKNYRKELDRGVDIEYLYHFLNFNVDIGDLVDKINKNKVLRFCGGDKIFLE